MTLKFHKSLTKEHWQLLSLAEQMGNVGSEVHRAIRWHEQHDQMRWQNAFDRALELLDLTITDQRWNTGKRELTRSREVFCSLFFHTDELMVSSDSIEKYFDQFALAARLKR